jgi:SWIB/MDM2 domain
LNLCIFLTFFTEKPIYITQTHTNHNNALEMEATKTVSKTNKMAKDTKTAKKTETPVAPAPAKKASKKTETAAKAEIVVPTVATPAVPAVVVTAPAVSQSSDVLLGKLTETLKALSAEFSSKVREAVKATQEAAKAAKKEHRESKRKHRKSPEEMTPEERKVWEARRANNAFLVQRPLSDELCSFMGLKVGDKRSQTEVTKYISEYVKTHNCYDPSFKRRIIPNAALMKLLKVDDKTEVTYLNLQKFLKVHFKKA